MVRVTPVVKSVSLTVNLANAVRKKKPDEAKPAAFRFSSKSAPPKPRPSRPSRRVAPDSGDQRRAAADRAAAKAEAQRAEAQRLARRGRREEDGRGAPAARAGRRRRDAEKRRLKAEAAMEERRRKRDADKAAAEAQAKAILEDAEARERERQEAAAEAAARMKKREAIAEVAEDRPAAASDSCDGPHATRDCPHFKGKPRDDHKDAFVNYNKGDAGGGDDAKPTIVDRGRATVVKQPGDGSCLYHSLTFGLGSGSAATLRAALADLVVTNPDQEIGGDPLRAWVLWESGLSPKAYADRMRSDGQWGGAIEMALCAVMKRVHIHVYEKHTRGFLRISSFTGGDRCQKVVSVIYGGRVHYGALRIHGDAG
ncbi:hypothetical protein JL722_6339 [Aureococcus anophagefferens]|nr:hypothetical protein JL722_6339 [Aureococcus anophagefferens]